MFIIFKGQKKRTFVIIILTIVSRFRPTFSEFQLSEFFRGARSSVWLVMFQKVALHYNRFCFHGVALRAPRCESFHAARETIKNSQLNVKVSQIVNNFHNFHKGLSSILSHERVEPWELICFNYMSKPVKPVLINSQYYHNITLYAYEYYKKYCKLIINQQ